MTPFVKPGKARIERRGLTSAEGLVPQCWVAESSPEGTLVLANMDGTRLLPGFSVVLFRPRLWAA